MLGTCFAALVLLSPPSPLSAILDAILPPIQSSKSKSSVFLLASAAALQLVKAPAPAFLGECRASATTAAGKVS